jgi:hypothetical protein
MRELASCPQTGYLNLFGTARIKKEGDRATESVISVIEFYAFLDNR